MARPRKQVYTMEQYTKNVSEGYITNDADTQRNPAWKPIVDGLSVTILTDDYISPIILAEEDSGQVHIVDGGSRTAAFQMIRFGNYKIKSSVENPIIPYKKLVKDENGKIKFEDAEFDIRNKTFDQFPKELQKKFDEYQIETVIHEHCNKEKIATYMIRYNTRKNFTANQKQFLYVPKFAEQIRDITKRSFFVNNCDIKDSEKENGILERTVTESVMITNYKDNWNKNGKKIATYINDNATEEQFEKLNNNIARLENIVTDDTKSLFNAKDSFIWFAFFEKFTELGFDDNKFADFLRAFVNGLRNKSVDGKLFDKVDEVGSTKDKSVVLSKLHILETLMYEFLNINKEDLKEIDVLEFIKENVNSEINNDDIELYKDCLDSMTVELDQNNRLLNKQNKPSLLAVVAYACDEDKDYYMEEWFEKFAKNHNTYIVNQKENFKMMKDSFENYLSKMEDA